MNAKQPFVANQAQNPETINGIKMFLSILPAVGAVLSFVFIAFYPLSEKRMKEVTVELQQKRENAVKK